MQKKISIFSFFSGIGILDLAFEKNGYNIVFVNEYDNLFIESYQYARMQMNLRAPIYGYRNDSAERYARRRGKKNLLALIAQEREKGNLVGFIGGPPCPDFSVAGKNAGVDGENGRLTKVYFDIICRCHPDFFLFENVRGLVKTEKHRAFYKEMMMKVQANDYVIAENVLNALAYGVPQFRERVFMVGIHKKIYQNEPNALIFKWDKHALFNTENVLTRTCDFSLSTTNLNIKVTRENVVAKGSITVRKVDATGAPLAGAELLLETSADGKTWTEVSRITTDKTGIAKWSDLKIGTQYRITEVKAPAGYTLLTEPLFTSVLDGSNRDITITACNSAGFVLPFTGGTGFTTYILFAALAFMAGVYFCKKSNIKEETTK